MHDATATQLRISPKCAVEGVRDVDVRGQNDSSSRTHLSESFLYLDGTFYSFKVRADEETPSFEPAHLVAIGRKLIRRPT